MIKVGPTIWLYDPYSSSDRITERSVIKVGRNLAHLVDGRKVELGTMSLRGNTSARAFLTREDLDAYLQHSNDLSRVKNKVSRLFLDSVTPEQVRAILGILDRTI